MSAARENTPLVELIVELKWLSPNAPAMQAQNTPILISSPQPSKVDEFFMQFGARIHSHGYTEVERLGVSGVAGFDGFSAVAFVIDCKIIAVRANCVCARIANLPSFS